MAVTLLVGGNGSFNKGSKKKDPRSSMCTVMKSGTVWMLPPQSWAQRGADKAMTAPARRRCSEKVIHQFPPENQGVTDGRHPL